MKVARVAALLASVAGALHAYEHPNLDRGFDPEKLYQFGEVDQVALQSGQLTAALPIGPRYRISEGFDVGLSLFYSASVWDYTRIGSGETAVLRVTATKRSNSGFGWRLSLGDLLAPGDPSNGTGN